MCNSHHPLQRMWKLDRYTNSQTNNETHSHRWSAEEETHKEAADFCSWRWVKPTRHHNRMMEPAAISSFHSSTHRPRRRWITPPNNRAAFWSDSSATARTGGKHLLHPTGARRPNPWTRPWRTLFPISAVVVSGPILLLPWQPLGSCCKLKNLVYGSNRARCYVSVSSLDADKHEESVSCTRNDDTCTLQPWSLEETNKRVAER